MSARKQIRKFCLWCSRINKEVSLCPVEDCALHPFRMGGTIKGTSKQKAIRRKCEDCLQIKYTGKCKMKSCELYGYREGHRPKVESSEDGIIQPKKTLSPEHLEKLQKGRAKNVILAQEHNATQPILIKRRRIHTNP